MRFYILLIFLSLTVVKKDYAQGQEFTVNNENVDTYYQVFGDGKRTMLIINGGPGLNSKGFEPLAKSIAERYGVSVIIYDQRGTGQSKIQSANAQNVTLDLMISDIEAIRKARGLDDWIVFGQSFGGMLAGYYASMHPDRVEKLILSSSGGVNMRDLNEVNIMGRLTSAEQDSFYYWNRALLRSPNDAKVRYRRNTFLASAYLVGSKHIAAVARRLGEVNTDLNQLVFSEMRRSSFDCSEGLKSFHHPTLILIGDNDVVSLGAAKRTHALLSNSTLVVIPRSGHYGWLENPEVYYGALDRLIRLVH